MKILCSPSPRQFALLFSAILFLPAHSARAAVNEASFSASSALGGSGDSVQGARIQADGSIVLAANISVGILAEKASGEAKGRGMVIRLAPGGTKFLSAMRLGAEVRDVALDASGNIYVALGSEGAAKLDPTGSKVLWKKETGGLCARIDAAADGVCAALNYSRDDDSSTGSGNVTVFAPDGSQIGSFKGRHNTLDVAIDGASKTVVTIGWKQAKAWDGKKKEPVQISHLTGRGYDGAEKFHLYDWSVDKDAPDFINKPTNNMADTRGYRCSMGADGKLHAAFESAGGNHIFRYEPQLENGAWAEAKGKIPKADHYHAFHNSRAEHKTFIGRYEPGTGKYLAGQQFTARLSDGRANAVRMKDGAVAAAADSSTYISGGSAAGLPFTFAPPDTGSYNGGGFVLGLNPALDSRLFCVRFQVGAEIRALDVRNVGGKRVVVFGGVTSGGDEGFWKKNAVQADAPTKSGFFAVMAAD